MSGLRDSENAGMSASTAARSSSAPAATLFAIARTAEAGKWLAASALSAARSAAWRSGI